MKTTVLALLILFAAFAKAQTNDPPILTPNLKDGFFQDNRGESAIANEGSLGGNFVVWQGAGTLDVVKSDLNGNETLKLSPRAELGDESTLLPCLIYRNMPEDFPRGVTFQARIKPDPDWQLSQCDVLSARVSDRGTGLSVTYRPDGSLLDVISGEGGVDGHYWGITSDKRTRISPSEWTHIAAVYDAESKQFRVYLNGQPAAESQTGLDLTAMSPTLTIGAYRGGYAYPFRGEIMDIAIYDYPRTEEQIQKDADGK